MGNDPNSRVGSAEGLRNLTVRFGTGRVGPGRVGSGREVSQILTDRVRSSLPGRTRSDLRVGLTRPVVGLEIEEA